ncbi:MAG: aldo/keto reductase [Gemmataceae bacterium]|nr:aldo/keto reductase [Gemmataceae bacterium]
MRPLGRTGLIVSRVGLGLAALGRPGYINLGHADDLNHSYDVEAMQARAHAVLDAAWDLGVRYFDAARSYGRGEEFLGTWLAARRIDPAQVVVASKWGYTYTAGWHVTAEKHEVKEHSRAVLDRQFAESQGFLGPYLDIYQIHSATQESGVLENAEVIRRLRELRSQGVKIGLSLSGPRQADTLRRAMELDLFDVVQATWNLLEPSVGPALAEAHRAGMGVVVKEALANGRLTERNHEPDFAPKLQKLRQLAERHGVGVDAIALSAVIAQPWADVVLSGAATVQQIRSNCQALAVAWTDDIADFAGMAAFAEPAEVYWSKRSALPWN